MDIRKATKEINREQTMESNMIERLFASFTELEAAIQKARSTFEAKDSIPESVVKRLASYDTILAKQRSLATSLCEAVAQKNWDEVNRNVTLINSLSAMIRDDARAILTSVSSIANDDVIDDVDDVENYC